MRAWHLKYMVTGLILGVLPSCASLKMPNLDFIKLPEFKEDAKNIGDYPSVADAPLAPQDIRSDKRWDKDARSLMKKRDALQPPVLPDALSDEEIEAEMQSLAAKAQAYKRDDPE